MSTPTVITSGLLAGAYNATTERRAVTHAHADGDERTLCGRVSAEKLAFTGKGESEPPTCAACLRRDPRFARGAEKTH